MKELIGVKIFDVMDAKPGRDYISLHGRNGGLYPVSWIMSGIDNETKITDL